jgi:hypothetical protein
MARTGKSHILQVEAFSEDAGSIDQPFAEEKFERFKNAWGDSEMP